ncbi:MAG: FAD-dependent thymidylate synthase [Deltaproteobacteria bacterium]|nr:FAD-dependent thymidylate synthase [Deltaproteobacteria bacterium]MCX7952407.1 FAD-dependent thymidylate synthase [Deltaproteobacteria bacterium]
MEIIPFDYLADQYGLSIRDGWPVIDSQVYRTSRGVRYLKKAGVVLVSRPLSKLTSLQAFLEGYYQGFEEYLKDDLSISDGEALIKFAGQTCYCSFGPKRTYNKDIKKYLNNLKSSGHGSVLEHANYSFLFYGVSRSLTHELVRHRAGFAYSQQSTRYVDEIALRFVERPEFQEDEKLHSEFVERIEKTYFDYVALKDKLASSDLASLRVDPASSHIATDRKKKINQTARMILSHEVEAPIVVTGNARAWRHFIEMRSHPSAELEIRNLAVSVFLCLNAIEKNLFDDYVCVRNVDGSYSLTTDFKKV